MSEELAELVRDLEDEQAALDAIVAALPADRWDLATPSPGWSIRDQISHLAFFDEVATLAVVDPARFAEEVTQAFADLAAYEKGYIDRGRACAPARVLAWWREARQVLVEAVRPLGPRARLPWYGTPMNVRSFVTARLMETWAHGQDVADALGIERRETDRLRHIAFLGVRTRAHAYVLRGREARSEPIRVELTLPSGARWTDGDASAREVIRGTARDFCLVVTQKRHVQDTDLVVEGKAAAEWMLIAQAFAGPPGEGRKAGQFPNGRA